MSSSCTPALPQAGGELDTCTHTHTQATQGAVSVHSRVDRQGHGAPEQPRTKEVLEGGSHLARLHEG